MSFLDVEHPNCLAPIGTVLPESGSLISRRKNAEQPAPMDPGVRHFHEMGNNGEQWGSTNIKNELLMGLTTVTAVYPIYPILR